MSFFLENIKDILNNLNLVLKNKNINNFEEEILNLIKKKNFDNFINFFEEKLYYSNENKKYKILIIFEDIFTFIIFIILLKEYLSYKKEENFYNLTFFINYDKEITIDKNNIILIFNNISLFQRIVFNYFDELFFLDSKINIIKKDLFLSFFTAQDLIELEILFINNHNDSSFIIKNDKNREINFFDNIKKILDIIKIKNLSAFSSAIQNEQYLRNFFRNLSLIKENYNITNIYSINNIDNRKINIFGASPKLNFFINLSSNNFDKIYNYINFSIISNIDLFLKNNLNLDFIFNFDTNFFSIFSFQKFFKIINFFKNIKLNFLTSLFCYPYLLNKSLKNSQNLNIVLFNFNTLLEKLVFNEIKLNNSYFSGTSINMLINFFDIISSEKQKKFELNIFGSDYENFDFNLNKVSHHKLYPLFYYLLKKENYIKNIFSWESKNIFYSKEKHNSYKLDLLNKNYYFLNLNFFKDIKEYKDFFSNFNEENKTEKYDLNTIDKNILIKNIKNLKNHLNNFLLEIESFLIKEKDENILDKYYYQNTNKSPNSLENVLFRELFFKEIYYYLTGKEINFKNKLKKLKKYINLI